MSYNIDKAMLGTAKRNAALFIMVLIAIFCALLLSADARVLRTKHDLSSETGPGPVKAIEETQICIFCHTPHNSKAIYPLWNHEVSAVVNYKNYWSPTLKSYDEGEAPPIDGFSKLCLGCHDGTVAVGAVNHYDYEEIEMTMRYISPWLDGYLGTDLSYGHPISIPFDEELVKMRKEDTTIMQLNWPINDPDVKLYDTQGGRKNGVQCTSCHDPHGGKGGPDAPPFWRKATHDEVCRICHDDKYINYPPFSHDPPEP